MEKWSEVADRFSRVTDRLGKPIDSGIFDTVIALNMLQIHTNQSCEGHYDYGLPYPWIDIEAPASGLLRQAEPPEIRVLQTQFTEMRKQLAEQEPEHVKRAKQQAKDEDLQQRYTLYQLLTEFYEHRHTSFDRIITFSLRGRIRSQGGDFVELLKPEERMQKLREYQEEMAAFTTFLKSRIVPECRK